MEYGEIIKNIIESIPQGVAWIRENLLQKFIPGDNMFLMVAGAIALILGYFWVKKVFATSIFLKLSLFLNYLLLALLIFLVITRVS